MDVGGLEFAAAAVVVVFAAAVQGTIGLGFNIVSVPLMSLINPLLAPVPQLILSIPQSGASAVRERSGVDRKGVAWILAGRFPGAVIGFWLLSIATDRVLDLMIGTSVLIAVIILASGVHLNRNAGIEFGAGIFAGVSSYVSTIGGPPMALLYSRDEGATVRSTLGFIFFVGTSITLTARIIAGDITSRDVVFGLALLPMAAIGFALSSWLKERTDAAHLRSGILVLSAVAAAALLVRALLG